MDIEKFSDTIVKELEERYPDCAVDTVTCLKNNGCKLHSVVIKRKDSNISPNIYLDGYYQDYCVGRRSIEELLDDIEKQHNGGVLQAQALSGFAFEEIRDYSKVSTKIRAKLINAKENKELLETVPSVPFAGDIVVVFKFLVQEGDDFVASILIKNDIFESWGIDIETLYNDVVANMKDIRFYRASELFRDKAESVGDNEAVEQFEMIMTFEDAHPEIPVMWTLSTENLTEGAAAILAYAKEVSQKIGGGNYYLLPSSVHEWMILSETDSVDSEDIAGMRNTIRDANQRAVSLVDFLSDMLYYYDAAEDKITVVE